MDLLLSVAPPVLFLILPWFAELAPLVVLGAAALAALHGRGKVLSSPAVVVMVVLTAAGAVAVAYLTGYFADWVWLESDDSLCALRIQQAGGTEPAGWLGLTRTDFPLHRTCTYQGGGYFELVPAWVNPAIFSYLALLILTPLYAALSKGAR